MRHLIAFIALLMPTVAAAQLAQAPTYRDTAGQVRGAQGTFCLNQDGTVCTTGGGGGSTPTGTAGSPNAAVVSVQGVSGGTLIPVASSGLVVTGDQAYTVGSSAQLNITPNGRLKVGISAAGNINPAAQLATTLTADLVGAKYYASRPTWSDGFTGSLQVDSGGNLYVNNATLPPGAATAAKQDSIVTALGTPFQTGGSIGNTGFAINGTLPAFASTPTVNIGTAPTLTVAQGTAANLNATVVGTGTFAVQAAQSGAYNITNITGTVSLPTGAATDTTTNSLFKAGQSIGNTTFAATSATAANFNAQVVGSVANGATDSGNGVKVSGVGTNAIAAVTAGQRADLVMDLNRNVRAALVGGTTATPVDTANTVNLPYANNAFTGAPLGALGYFWNGSAAVIARGDTTGSFTVPQPVATASAGIAPATAAGVTSQVLKASAGNLYGLNVDNAAVAGTYVIVYNAASAPAGGAALTASLELWHAALGNGTTLDKAFPTPLYANTGITVLYSTSLTTYTAPATAPLLSTGMFK